jgi:NADH dehydrogenase
MDDLTAPHIVVVGAGFAGLEFCHSFSHPTARITLVDRQNHHLFQPLLYQVATAGLAAPEIAQPVRSILAHQPAVTVHLRSVHGFDLAQKEVLIEDDRIKYDYLVVALGGVTSYFGHPEWANFAPGLKSIDDALLIRRRILLAFERAENSSDTEERRRLMTIVVVGGGPTGVELAGAFAELTRHVLKRDFRHIDPSHARVILIEASSRVLDHFSERLSAKALQQLTKMGVEVRLKTRVESMGEGYLATNDGNRIESENMIWAAGVSAHPLARELSTELDRGGRVKVNPDLSVPGHPEVFAIGDMCTVMDKNGKPVPGVSPAAMQMGRHVARIIEHELKAGPAATPARPPFQYWNRGSMATIGRSAAVAEIGRFEFSGWLAWAAWLFIHLIFLIGFRNRVAVLIQWTYSYFTYKLGSRIITGLDGKRITPHAPGGSA